MLWDTGGVARTLHCMNQSLDSRDQIEGGDIKNQENYVSIFHWKQEIDCLPLSLFMHSYLYVIPKKSDAHSMQGLTCTIVSSGLNCGFRPHSVIIFLHFFCEIKQAHFQHWQGGEGLTGLGQHTAVPGKIPFREGEKRAVVDLYTMALFWEVNEFSSAGGTRTYLL